MHLSRLDAALQVPLGTGQMNPDQTGPGSASQRRKVRQRQDELPAMPDFLDNSLDKSISFCGVVG
jgi:hypothetical protein